MVNYFFLEYFRKLAGLTHPQISEVCGKTGSSAKNYYSRAINEHFEMPEENIMAIADALGIVPEWITQSPVVLVKQDLDNYIDQYLKDSPTPIIKKTDKPNQYTIISYESAEALKNFADKKNEISRKATGIGQGMGSLYLIEDYTTLLKQSFLPDPDYEKMPLRPLLDYASRAYDSVPSFVRAFASRYPDEITKPKAEALIRDMTMARTLPFLTVDRKIMDCFASFINVTLDQALCDFRLSSSESVFNLFLAVSVTVSGWVLSDDGDVTLTLTNPEFLPSSKAAGADSVASNFPAGFKL